MKKLCCVIQPDIDDNCWKTPVDHRFESSEFSKLDFILLIKSKLINGQRF